MWGLCLTLMFLAGVFAHSASFRHGLTTGIQLMNTEQVIKHMQADWTTNPRWAGVKRGYGAEDVLLHCGH